MEKREGGPSITYWEGNILSMSVMDNMLHKFLIRLYERGESFPRKIKSVDGIIEGFSVFRSLRRVSTTRAMNQNVSSNGIGIINSWKPDEVSKGKRLGGPTRQHYAEFSLLKGTFLRYTHAM